MSELDKAFHLVASATENIHWHDFREVGALGETECDYYYAENELYVIRDRCYLVLWFVKARNPIEALHKYENSVRNFQIAFDGRA